ncbi:hypothetical protein SCUCBS95973_000731 [Sporothrix curviconia]|uniref:Uncharacterized protein n=1 Tax=Sporothrix curviconia TaxID=1260050 RepID=A0ABP0ASQ7_9PEZI
MAASTQIIAWSTEFAEAMGRPMSDAVALQVVHDAMEVDLRGLRIIAGTTAESRNLSVASGFLRPLDELTPPISSSKLSPSISSLSSTTTVPAATTADIFYAFTAGATSKTPF